MQILQLKLLKDRMLASDRITEGVTDIVVSRDFDVSAERIYTAFTAPLALADWFGPMGWSAEPDSILVEPRPYGRYRLTLYCDDDPSRTFAIRARLLELIPSRLIIVEERTTSNEMLLQVEITPTGPHGCRVDLHHGPISADDEAMAAIGWESALAKLASRLRVASAVG